MTFKGLKIKHGARLPYKKNKIKKNASLSFLGVFFKAHSMVPSKKNVLNKLIEQFIII